MAASFLLPELSLQVLFLSVLRNSLFFRFGLYLPLLPFVPFPGFLLFPLFLLFLSFLLFLLFLLFELFPRTPVAPQRLHSYVPQFCAFAARDSALALSPSSIHTPHQKKRAPDNRRPALLSDHTDTQAFFGFAGFPLSLYTTGLSFALVRSLEISHCCGSAAMFCTM
jgi:hypothetical protein